MSRIWSSCVSLWGCHWMVKTIWPNDQARPGPGHGDKTSPLNETTEPTVHSTLLSLSCCVHSTYTYSITNICCCLCSLSVTPQIDMSNKLCLCKYNKECWVESVIYSAIWFRSNLFYSAFFGRISVNLFGTPVPDIPWAKLSSLWEMKTEEKLLNSIFFSIYYYHIPRKTNIVNQLRTNTKSRMWITIYLLFVCFLLYWNLNVSLHKPK